MTAIQTLKIENDWFKRVGSWEIGEEEMCRWSTKDPEGRLDHPIPHGYCKDCDCCVGCGACECQSDDEDDSLTCSGCCMKIVRESREHDNIHISDDGETIWCENCIYEKKCECLSCSGGYQEDEESEEEKKKTEEVLWVVKQIENLAQKNRDLTKDVHDRVEEIQDLKKENERLKKENKRLEEAEDEDDYGIGWSDGWIFNGCKWKWDGCGPMTQIPTGPPPQRYWDESPSL